MAVFVGAFWLAAWLTGNAATWSAQVGVITVKTDMAVCLVLSGTALLLLGVARPTPTRRFLGRSAALMVLVTGGLTLSEHLTAWNLHIDELLASDPSGAAATASPNRIGPPGSASLLLLGAGLLCLRSRRRSVAPYFGLSVCVINLARMCHKDSSTG